MTELPVLEYKLLPSEIDQEYVAPAPAPVALKVVVPPTDMEAGLAEHDRPLPCEAIVIVAEHDA